VKRPVKVYRIEVLSPPDPASVYHLGRALLYSGKGWNHNGVITESSWFMGPESIPVDGPMGLDYTRERMTRNHCHEVEKR
jgi:hypothetical protein